MNLGAANGSTFGQLFFLGTQTLGGNGTVVFGSSTSNALYEKISGTGTLTVDTGITIQGGSGVVSGNGTFGASESVVNNGRINAAVAGQGINLNPTSGGTLTNTGTMEANNGGTLTFGKLASSHAGIIHVGVGSVAQVSSGTLSQSATAQVNLDVRGLGNSNFGRLNVSNATALAGTLNVSFTNGYVPNLGDSFQLLTFASRSGVFSVVNSSGLDAGKALAVTYNATNVMVTVVSALVGATSPALPDSIVLTRETLDSTIASAILLWESAGLTSSCLQRLHSLSFQVGDLGSNYLGYTTGNTIWIDDNAANWGWFVDGNPLDDSEFADPDGDGILDATADSPANSRMDLLSVVLHELGHALGADHSSSANDVMFESLNFSQRKKLSQEDIDAVFSKWS